MAINERNRLATHIHSIVAILLLLGGGALVGAGIWLLASDKGGRLPLDYTGSSFWNYVLNFGVAAIIAGVFLLVAALAALISLSRKCLGKVFRVVYVLMALVILAALLFIAIVSLLIVDKRDAQGVEDFVEEAWERSVTSNDSDLVEEVCKIQDRWDCLGFADNDCTGCENGEGTECDAAQQRRCPTCAAAPTRDASKGCFDEIKGTLKRIYLPMGIVASVLAAIVLLDVFVVCCI